MHLEEPWPTDVTNKDDIIDALFDPDTGVPDWPHSNSRAIVHFACHCDTRGQSTNDYTLRLRSQIGPKVDIQLKDLQVGYIARSALGGIATPVGHSSSLTHVVAHT